MRIIHKLRKIVSLLTVMFVFCNSVFAGQAPSFMELPKPGEMVPLSASFQPPLLQGIKVYPNEPLRVDFIVDKGDATLTEDQTASETGRLIKYFLAALTVPESDLWVNLSPYEKDRITTDAFGKTEMGRDLLGEDYILKQLASSLLHPDGELGKKVWSKIYAKAREKYASEDIPLDMFNKVWIVPAKAEVYRNPKAGSAYIVEARLKVMLEADYLAINKSGANTESPDASARQELGKEIIRQVVLPVLEKEINEGENFVRLRQVYQSLILAMWYKQKVRASLLSKAYVNQQKILGVNIDDPKEADKIWMRYVEAFKKGAFNLIREEKSSDSAEDIVRKYVSGGVVLTDKAMSSVLSYRDTAVRTSADKAGRLLVVRQMFQPLTQDGKLMAVDAAMTDSAKRKLPVIEASRYESMKHWLDSLPQESLQRKIALWTMIENTVQGLRSDSPNYRKASSDTLFSLMTSGLMSPEEMLKPGGALEMAIRNLRFDSYWEVRRISAEIITYLLEKEVIVNDRVKKVLAEQYGIEALRENLTPYSHIEVFKASCAGLKALIRSGAVSRRDVEKEEGILQALFDSITQHRDPEARRASVDVLVVLREQGIISKAELKALVLSRVSVNGLIASFSQPSFWHLRHGAFAALDALAKAGLMERVSLEAVFRERDIVGQVIGTVNSVGGVNDVRLGSILLLKEMISEGWIHQENAAQNMMMVDALLQNIKEDRDGENRHASADVLGGMIKKEILQKGVVIKKIRDRKLILNFAKNLSQGGWQERKASSMALDGMIQAGLVSPKDVFGEHGIVYLLLENAAARTGDDFHSNVRVLRALVAAGMIGKDELGKFPQILDFLRSGLLIANNMVSSKVYVETLSQLVNAGAVTREMLINKFGLTFLMSAISVSWDMEFRNAVVSLLADLIRKEIVTLAEVHQEVEDSVIGELYKTLGTDWDQNLRQAGAAVLSGLTTTGILNRADVVRDIRRNKIDEYLFGGIKFDDEGDASLNSMRALHELIKGGLFDDVDGFSEAEIKAALHKVYGQDMPASNAVEYLRFLTILKSVPQAAYYAAFWSADELKELFGLLDLMVKGLLSRTHAQSNIEYFRIVEKMVVDELQEYISTPQVFIARMKQKVRDAIIAADVKLAIKVYEVASLHAAKGLIEYAGLPKEKIVILYEQEVTEKQAAEFFPGHIVKEYNAFSAPNVVRIEFHDRGAQLTSRFANRMTLSLPYTPFKFYLAEKDREEAKGIKAALNTGAREIIVLGSPSDREFNEFMQVYNALYAGRPAAQRPLIIVGFRLRRDDADFKVFGPLSGQSIAVRSHVNMPFPDMSNNNVLILNTVGELYKLYGVADVAVVGEDRNLFEPVSQEAPVLFFEGSWENNLDGKRQLTESGAVLEFNQRNFEMLLGQKKKAGELAAKGLEVVGAVRKQIAVQTEECLFRLIAEQDELRKSFIPQLEAIDLAMLSAKDVGGIDLTSSAVNMQASAAQDDIHFIFSPELLRQLRYASGLRPQILNMQPLDNLNHFLEAVK